MSYGVTFRGNEPINTVTKQNRVQNCPPENPNCGQVNFRGKKVEGDYYDGPKKKNTGWKILGAIVGLAAVAGGSIYGLGRLSKVDISKIEKTWLKEGLEKLEPVTDKCNQWCNTAKEWGTGAWKWVTELFKGKPKAPDA